MNPSALAAQKTKENLSWESKHFLRNCLEQPTKALALPQILMGKGPLSSAWNVKSLFSSNRVNNASTKCGVSLRRNAAALAVPAATIADAAGNLP